METDHQTSLTFFSFIESVKATIFLKDTSLSTEKGGSWVNVKSDSNWPGAQYNLEITEIQPHLKTTVSPPDCPTLRIINVPVFHSTKSSLSGRRNTL